MDRGRGTNTFPANCTDRGLVAACLRQPDGLAGAVLTDDGRFTYPYHAPETAAPRRRCHVELWLIDAAGRIWTPL